MTEENARVDEGQSQTGRPTGSTASSNEAIRTIRSMVKKIQVELRDTDVAPSRARELLIELTALSGNCSTEVRQAEAEYSAVLLKQLDSEEKANRAKIRAQNTPEHLRMREAKDTFVLVVEMIRSLKVVLKSQEEELRMAR